MATNQEQIKLANVGRNEISQQQHKSDAYCPQTGKRVGQQIGEKFLLPGGQATWWHCPACGGWHVTMQE